MNSALLKEKIEEEIARVPADKLAELYDLICSFRWHTDRSVETAPLPSNIPGDWENISDQIFNRPVIR
jgi:hypothetical protein